MFQSPHLFRRSPKLLLKTALLVGLAPAAILASQTFAQAGQGMSNMPGMGDSKAPQATSASAIGTVESVDAAQRKIKLNHEPIPAFNWPAMSMEMTAAKSVDLGKAKPGTKVKFTLEKGMDGTYTVKSLEAAP